MKALFSPFSRIDEHFAIFSAFSPALKSLNKTSFLMCQSLLKSSVERLSACECDTSDCAGSPHLSCLVAFNYSTTWPVSLAFPACRSALFYLGVREVKVELRLSLTPPFYRVIPDRLWPDSLRAADVKLISDSPDTLSDSICLRTCAPGKLMPWTSRGFRRARANQRTRRGH